MFEEFQGALKKEQCSIPVLAVYVETPACCYPCELIHFHMYFDEDSSLLCLSELPLCNQ